MSVYTHGGNMNVGHNQGGAVQPWRRWQDWVNLILGVWLFIVPWIWHSTAPTPASATGPSSGWGAWVMWIIGIVVVVMALWALSSPAVAIPEWINVIAGIWLFIAPWVLGVGRIGAPLSWNLWVVGILVIVFAAWAASQIRGTGATTREMRT